jgi:PAS domain S-box-containing protein
MRELEHYFAIIDSAEDAIISKDLEGVVRSWNPAAERMFGYTAAEAIGKPITLIIPDYRLEEEPVILDKIFHRGERIQSFETVRRRKDGSCIDVSLTISPILDSDGLFVGASKIARDIIELRRAQRRQQLLLREMSHRVKNIFGVAGSVVALCGSAETPREVVNSACERLAALARAHLLTISQTEDQRPVATTLHSLIKTIVAPFNEHAGGQTSRISISGVDTPVSGSGVTNLALLFQELVTNAAKYGALSTTAGSAKAVCVEEKGSVTISWAECGGPPVIEPRASEGFGSILSRRATQLLEGKIEREWRPEGLAVRLTLPSSRLTD